MPPLVLLGVVAVGVAVPPVLEDGAGVGVTAVPPVLPVEPDVLGVAAVVDVVVVEVVAVVDEAAGVVVPPDGGAVSAGVVSGTS